MLLNQQTVPGPSLFPLSLDLLPAPERHSSATLSNSIQMILGTERILSLAFLSFVSAAETKKEFLLL